MDERREVRIPWETVMKRSWPLLALGAVLVCAVIIGLIWFAVSGKGRRIQSKNTETISVQGTATSTADYIGRELDGLLVTPAEAQLQSYAVMVENHVDARPLSGPAQANLVYEIPVEGGITRFMLVFDATTTVDMIGPVRSARPYFVDVANGLHAVYAHVGGSTEALQTIATVGSAFRDVNEMHMGKYFWRSAKRVAPHMVFTRMDLLQQASIDKQWQAKRFRSWFYKEDAPLQSTTSSIRGSTKGPLLEYGGSYTASWSYDRNENVYIRAQTGTIQKDADGQIVRAKNIVTVTTDGSVIDSEGRLKIRTTGKGRGQLYRDGEKIDVTWKRASGEHIQFETIDGNDVLFNRGTTWVEFLVTPK